MEGGRGKARGGNEIAIKQRMVDKSAEGKGLAGFSLCADPVVLEYIADQPNEVWRI